MSHYAHAYPNIDVILKTNLLYFTKMPNEPSSNRTYVLKGNPSLTVLFEFKQEWSIFSCNGFCLTVNG